MILAYRGYGNQHQVFFKGHVLDDRILYESQKGDKRRKNFQAMLSRYLSSVIPDIRVEVSFHDQTKIFKTNENGLFEGEMFFEQALSDGWQMASYTVLDKIVDAQELMTTQAEIYIQGGNSQYAVISDIDDTILISHSTQLLRKLRLIFTKNAHTRLPFPGVAPFYQALQKGIGENTMNPIFYVSSSEWNLYDFLEDFCDHKQIPKGVFLLQDLKTSFQQFFKRDHQHQHKYNKVKSILEFFPQLQFILIGDNGQKDPVLYAKIVKEFPDRIKTIYIRAVHHPSKVFTLKSQNTSSSVQAQMVLVSNTGEAAEHAFQEGYICKNGLDLVWQSIEETAK